MTLNSKQLSVLCDIAIRAAVKAGTIIANFPHSKLLVDNKVAGDSRASQVVTEVDILSQNAILELLEPSLEKYDLALLTEESKDDLERLEKDYFWCIDPLDGTLPFIESTTGYAVSIALVSKAGESVLGVVYDPCSLTQYHAIKGAGAFRNGTSWQLNTKEQEDSKTFNFISDRSFFKSTVYPKVEMELEQLCVDIGIEDLAIVKHGGAVMNACWVLENSPACYFKFPKPKLGGGSIWDYAATACVFKEIGGVVSDIWGKDLNLNPQDSTFLNHCGVVFAHEQKIANRIIKVYSKLAQEGF